MCNRFILFWKTKTKEEVDVVFLLSLCACLLQPSRWNDKVWSSDKSERGGNRYKSQSNKKGKKRGHHRDEAVSSLCTVGPQKRMEHGNRRQ